MFRKMKILIIAEFFILNHVSYVLSRRLNLTQLIKESLDPELYQNALRVISSKRDVPYLPEDYYNDAENGVNKLQQLDRDSRNLITEYRNLCETITRRVEIADPDYEYQPPTYHEVYCKSYSLLDNNEQTRPSQQECAYPIFHCVQRTRVLSLVRRRWDDECWEPYTKEIASGCDCMWPVASLGEISHHY